MISRKIMKKMMMTNLPDGMKWIAMIQYQDYSSRCYGLPILEK